MVELSKDIVQIFKKENSLLYYSKSESVDDPENPGQKKKINAKGWLQDKYEELRNTLKNHSFYVNDRRQKVVVKVAKKSNYEYI